MTTFNRLSNDVDFCTAADATRRIETTVGLLRLVLADAPPEIAAALSSLSAEVNDLADALVGLEDRFGAVELRAA